MWILHEDKPSGVMYLHQLAGALHYFLCLASTNVIRSSQFQRLRETLLLPPSKHRVSKGE
jgi:hypothetical protein